jgi:hypothetical protein
VSNTLDVPESADRDPNRPPDEVSTDEVSTDEVSDDS